MAMTPGFLRNTQRVTPFLQLAPEGNGILMEGTWNDFKEWKGGSRSNAVVFWHQVRKKAELWAGKYEFCKLFDLFEKFGGAGSGGRVLCYRK